jgi:hypothetical protein
MRRGVVASLLALGLVAGACHSASKETAQSPTSTTTSAPAPATCDGIGPAPTSTPDITFVAAGRLQAVSVDGTGAHCLADGVTAAAHAPMAWGGAGDRLLLPPTSVFLGEQRLSAGVGPNAIAILSRPNGTSVLAVGQDHHLRKHPLAGGPFSDISFLARTDEAIYHPGGRFIAAVGVDRAGNYGISIATNQGKDPHKLAEAESAKRIYSLAFSQDGERLYFLADHGDHGDVHTLDLRAGALSTLFTDPTPFEHLVTSPFTRAAAISTHDCVDVLNGLGVHPGPKLAAHSLDPVGFLADGRLVLLARTKGSTGPADVYVLGPGAPDPPPITRAVESVAIRQPLPPPGELPNAINPAPA